MSFSTLKQLQATDVSLIDSMSAFQNALQVKDAVRITHIFFQSRHHLGYLYFAADKFLLASLITILSHQIDLLSAH